MSKISIFRTSFVWGETVPDLLSQRTFLGDYGVYGPMFSDLQAGKSAALKLPWNVRQGEHFWKFYFEGKHAGDAKLRAAWRKAVPLRADLSVATTSPAKPDVKMSFELFYTAFGVSVVATANYRGADKSPTEIAKLALDARHNYLFRLASEPPTVKAVSLQVIASRALEWARQNSMKSLASATSAGPFSVTTFLQAKQATAIVQGSDEHFLLEAVTGWDPGLTSAQLAALPLADARLSKVRGGDTENLVYARDGGRAIWFPQKFVDNKKPLLRCYHRNMMHASLQAQSMGTFVSWVAGQKALNRPIDPAIVDHAKDVAATLDLLANGGTSSFKASYRSASVEQQVAKAKWAADIKTVKAL